MTKIYAYFILLLPKDPGNSTPHSLLRDKTSAIFCAAKNSAIFWTLAARDENSEIFCDPWENSAIFCDSWPPDERALCGPCCLLCGPCCCAACGVCVVVVCVAVVGGGLLLWWSVLWWCLVVVVHLVVVSVVVVCVVVVCLCCGGGPCCCGGLWWPVLWWKLKCQRKLKSAVSLLHRPHFFPLVVHHPLWGVLKW